MWPNMGDSTKFDVIGYFAPNWTFDHLASFLGHQSFKKIKKIVFEKIAPNFLVSFDQQKMGSKNSKPQVWSKWPMNVVCGLGDS